MTRVDAGGNATVPIDKWHVVGAAGEPAFQNGWVALAQGFSLPAFHRDPLGVVHLRGSVTGGTQGAAAFTLPAGYRPVAAYRTPSMAAQAGNSWAQVNVYPDGGVLVWSDGAAGTYCSLDQIEVDTETVTAMPTGPKGDPGPPGNGSAGALTAYAYVAANPNLDAATWAALPIDTVPPNNDPGHCIDLARHGYVCPAAGWYDAAAQFQLIGVAGYYSVRAAIAVNGTIAFRGNDVNTGNTGATGTNPAPMVAGKVLCAKGDLITAQTYSSGPGPMGSGVSDRCFLTVSPIL